MSFLFRNVLSDGDSRERVSGGDTFARRPPSVLIVGGSAEERGALRCLLPGSESRPCSISESPCAEEGLRRCRHGATDCVLLDCHRPDLDLIAFLIRLRAQCGEDTVAVVLVVSPPDEEAAIQLLGHGAHGYLLKGHLTPWRVGHAVDSAVEKTALMRRVQRQWMSLASERGVAREREQLFGLLMDNAPAAIAMLDRELRYLSVSRRWLSDFGLEGQDLGGRRHYDVFPDIPEHWKQAHRRCLDGSAEVDEVEFRRADGRVQWLRREIRPWHTVDDRVGGIIIFCEDVTRAKECDRRPADASQHFAAFMQHLPALAWIKDQEGRYVYANAAVESCLGLPRDRILGSDDATLLPTESRENDRRVLERRTGLEALETLRRADGEARHAMVSRFPIFDGEEATHVGAVAIDVTPMRQAQESLQAVTRRKEEFIAMLSHELRNPLAPLLNAAYVVEQFEFADPRLRHMQGIIKRQVAQLSGLLDGLLDVSRIAQGKIEPKLETVDLLQVIDRAVEAVRATALGKGLQMEIEVPGHSVWMRGDEVRLTQMLNNLLDNAVKYTPPGGRVELAASASDHTIEIRVSDDGIGIPADLLPHVFDLFRQGEQAPDRPKGGLGIGLALVKRLADLFGGEVAACSAGAHRGATFTLRLPLRAEMPPDTQTSLPETAASAPTQPAPPDGA